MLARDTAQIPWGFPFSLIFWNHYLLHYFLEIKKVSGKSIWPLSSVPKTCLRHCQCWPLADHTSVHYFGYDERGIARFDRVEDATGDPGEGVVKDWAAILANFIANPLQFIGLPEGGFAQFPCQLSIARAQNIDGKYATSE